MTINAEVREAVKKLMRVCEMNNIALSGVLESQDKNITTFASHREFQTKRGDCIQRLIRNKGDVNQYLLELSQIDVIAKQRKKAEAAISEITERVLSYQNSNPQVTRTKH
jgi:hypothetical protein